MAKITLPVYVMWTPHQYSDKLRACPYEVWMQDMSSIAGRVLALKTEVEFDIPANFNPIPACIKGLKKEQQEIRAEAEEKVQRIETNIQNMLALEHRPQFGDKK